MTVKQRAALQALMACNSRKEAAARAGIGERTLREYFREPEFVQAYNEMFGELIAETTFELQKSLRLAVNTLRAVCEDPEASQAAKSTAAYRLLDVAPKFAEVNNFAERIEKIEREHERK